MTAGQKIGYALLSSLMGFLSIFPLGFHRVMSRWVSHLAYSVIRYRRDDVMMNMARAFPEKDIHELKRLRKLFYRHFGDIVGEAVWFGGCRDVERLRKSHIVEIANPGLLNDLYGKGKSIIALASHNGNWELFGGLKTYGSYNGPLDIPENDLSVVYLRQTSEVWNKFLYKNRLTPIEDKEHFDGLQESRDIMRYVYNNRLKRKLYVFINDQRPYFESTANMEVTFMHQKAMTMTGAVALAKMFGMSVVYLNMKADGEGKYVIELTTLCEDAADKDIKDIIDSYYRHLEKDLEEVPWNYLWTHHRWQ